VSLGNAGNAGNTGNAGKAGDVVAEAAAALRAGGVALVPTDTVYGLAVHPERDDAIDRLFAMKRRPRSRNLPVQVASVDALPALGVEITEPARKLMAAFFPGPLSLALGLGPAAPAWLAGRVEVAVRIPADEQMLQLLRETGPLLVTSANLHAEATAESVGSILAALDGKPDAVIDGGPRTVVPSTLVNCNLPTPRIERLGTISQDAIEQVLQ
jgi:L-threonylcarbamoyladenylate synthase